MKEKKVIVKPAALRKTDMSTLDEQMINTNEEIKEATNVLKRLYEKKRNLEVAQRINDGNETFLPAIALGLVSSPIGQTMTLKEDDVVVENTLVELWKSRYGFYGVPDKNKKRSQKEIKAIKDKKHRIYTAKRTNPDIDNIHNDNDNVTTGDNNTNHNDTSDSDSDSDSDSS